MASRVLVVDNEPDLVTVFTKGLQKYGFKVTGYTDPLVALADFKTDYYDIVLLDYKMPKLDGLELYEKMVKIDSKPNYVFMTAGEDIKNFAVVPKSTIARLRIIRKPISISKLVLQIHNILTEA